jgi:repressor LexA
VTLTKGGKAEEVSEGCEGLMADTAPSSRPDAGPESGCQLIARLARRRAALGLSQADIARSIQTSQSAVARLESGRTDVRLSTLTRYARALSVSLDVVDDTKARDEDRGVGVRADVAHAPPDEHAFPEQAAHAAPPQDDAEPFSRAGLEPRQGVPEVVAEAADWPGVASDLTGRQRKVLAVIRDSVQRRGYPPSMREIGEAVGLASTSSVSFQLSVLQSKGYLRRDRARSRTVEVRAPGPPAMRSEDEIGEDAGGDIPGRQTADIPFVGSVAAGGLVLAGESGEDVIRLPTRLTGGGALFAVKVTGDSMIGAALADGDLVVVKQQQEADNGDIVVAMIDGETTLKTFLRSDDHVWLMPQNPLHAPVLGDKATIVGRAVAVLRKL